ncbi:UNVERIFIED_CONTAM: hypothetical protein FKN15_045252 [Acipenser sinensis]
MYKCDRARMILGVRSPSRPARQLHKGNRIPCIKWHDSLFPGLGGSWPSSKVYEVNDLYGKRRGIRGLEERMHLLTKGSCVTF